MEDDMRRTMAILAVLALSLTACGGTDPELDPGDLETPLDDEATDDDAVDDVDETTEPGDDAAGTDDTSDAAGDATAPEPDPAELAAPCEGHEDRIGEAFIELVSPVDDQQVGSELRLVGCSNVYEATVSYRLLDGDGRTLDEGFTTAECGSGCVGAFDETVDLTAAEGEPVVYVQVFWESAEDGSDRDLEERIVVLG
jgi:predicted small lipoprotein YifL